MRKKSLLSIFVAVLLLSILQAPALAGSREYKIPIDRIKDFLLNETGYVAKAGHINGWYDDGKGKVTVYCTREVAGQAIVGQILYQFLLLQTDSGPRWLYLGNVKSQFIDAGK